MPLPVGTNPAAKAGIKKWLEDRLKFPSGYCNEHGKAGQHEGMRPQDWRGRPMPTCPMWLQCPCKCHYEVDQLFIATGMERREMSNPDYKPDLGKWVMPEVVDPITGAASSDVGGEIAPPSIEDAPVTPPVAVQTPLAQRRTALGYAGRGTLEAQVWDACRSMDGEMTTKAVSEWIAAKYEIGEPSRGAIQAVWIRWDKVNFGSFERKPVQFTGFLGEGTWEQLEQIKSSVKQKAKSAEAQAKRGTLRKRA